MGVKFNMTEEQRQRRRDNGKKAAAKTWAKHREYMALGMKPCNYCKQVKPLTDFYKERGSCTGVSPCCKRCRRIVKHKKFGLTLEIFDQLHKKQEGRCAICGAHEKEKKFLVVDHCHETQKIRGLLCQQCNSAIGILKHSEDILLKAIEYLRAFKTIPSV